MDFSFRGFRGTMQRCLAGLACLLHYAHAFPMGTLALLPTQSARILSAATWAGATARRRRAVCMQAGDDSGIRDNPDNEPIVPPARKEDVQNLLPMGDGEYDFDVVRDFVQEFVVPSASAEKKSPTVGKDGVINIPVDADAEPTSLGPVVQPKISMIFTCCRCETRQMRSFTRLAYEKGIVIVQCKGCGVRHLIADNLGWYYDWLEKGDTNVQDIMARKGVDVPRLDGEDALALWEEWKEQEGE